MKTGRGKYCGAAAETFFLISLLFGALGIVLFFSEGAAGIDLSYWPEDCYALWAVKDGVAGDLIGKVSHTDWLGWNKANWGRPGVRLIINKAASAGVRTIWWRSHGGGLCSYPSELAESTYAVSPTRGVDYSRWDPFSEAISQAHKLGMKINLWVTPLEESHMWPEHNRSRYTDLHKDLWGLDKSGAVTPMPSFFYKAYRDYKLAIIDEILGRWEFDGIVLAMNIMGAPTPASNWGYIPELMDAFEAETGRDPMAISEYDSEWVAFRASYVGQYVDAVKDRVDVIKQTRPFELILQSMIGREFNPRINMPLWIQERCDALSMNHWSDELGWGYIGDPDRAFAYYDEVPVPKIFPAYVYKGSDESILAVCQDVLAQGIKIVWNETTTMRYWVSGALAFEPSVEMVRQVEFDSPVSSIEGRVLGFCSWSLSANGQTMGSGGYGNAVEFGPVSVPSSSVVNLSFAASRLYEKSHTGLSAVITVHCEDGSEHVLMTDDLWQLDGGSGHLEKVGQPGAIPFTALN